GGEHGKITLKIIIRTNPENYWSRYNKKRICDNNCKINDSDQKFRLLDIELSSSFGRGTKRYVGGKVDEREKRNKGSIYAIKAQTSNQQDLDSKVVKMKRLPPQVLYAGETTIIDLSDFFSSTSQVSYFVYCLDDSEEMNGAQVHCPYWLDFDHKYPRFVARPPKNLSLIEPAYTVRVLAKPLHSSNIAEEELVLIVQHTCFEKCPKHFGVGCTDWELMMTAAGAYGLIMFALGIFCHHTLHFCVESYQRERAKRSWRKPIKKDTTEHTDSDNETSSRPIRNSTGVVDVSTAEKWNGIVSLKGNRDNGSCDDGLFYFADIFVKIKGINNNSFLFPYIFRFSLLSFAFALVFLLLTAIGYVLCIYTSLLSKRLLLHIPIFGLCSFSSCIFSNCDLLWGKSNATYILSFYHYLNQSFLKEINLIFYFFRYL
ncbi:hypothetical protein RFI_05125, partial [Reticulomyxa filosa]